VEMGPRSSCEIVETSSARFPGSSAVDTDRV
jgi:hypothetical protein